MSVQLLAPDPTSHVTDLRIGHMEARAAAPVDGISCGIPTIKRPDRSELPVGHPFIFIITVTNPYDCKLTNVHVVDDVSATRDVKFVILCRREEIVPELRQLPNVVYSKDYASGVLNDLALLQVSHLSLMPDAGFVNYPWFCGLPTVYFGKQLHEIPERRLKNERGQGLKFLTRFQRRCIGAYDADILEREFMSLYDDLAAAAWRNPNL